MAKVVAMTLLTMTLSLVPAVILWLGRQLVDDSPWQAIRDNVGDLGRVILIGSLTALVLGTIGLALSSLTDRKVVAVIVILIGFLIFTAMGNIGYELLQDEEWSRYLILLSISDVFAAVSEHLFHDGQNWFAEQADLPLWL